MGASAPGGIASCHLIFVSGKGFQDFGLLALGDLEVIQAPSELRSDFVELCGGDPEIAMSLLKAKRRCAGRVAVNLKGPPETSQTQSVRMNLRLGSLSKLLVCHSRSCGFFDS